MTYCLKLILDTRSPFTRPGRAENAKLMMLGDLPESETDISFVSSGRPSTDRISVSLYNDCMEFGGTNTTNGSTRGYEEVSSSRLSISQNMVKNPISLI